MTRREKDPLRPLTDQERHELERLSRAQAEPAAIVARAKALLAVAGGRSFTDAARSNGRRSGDAVGQLVARFHRDGLAGLESGHGGGQPKRYTQTEQKQHPQAGTRREARRAPDRDKDKTATWSLSTLRGALRRAPDDLPEISIYTIWCVLHDAGFTWDRDRSWCETGTAVRQRKSEPVTVVDPDATPKTT